MGNLLIYIYIYAYKKKAAVENASIQKKSGGINAWCKPARVLFQQYADAFFLLRHFVVVCVGTIVDIECHEK